MTWFKLQIEFFDDFLWNSANMKEIAIVLQRKNIIKQMKLQTIARIIRHHDQVGGEDLFFFDDK